MSFGVSRKRNTVPPKGQAPKPEIPVYIRSIGTDHVISPPNSGESIGKNLVLRSGDGSLRDGKLLFNINGNDVVKVSKDKVVFNKPLALGGNVYPLTVNPGIIDCFSMNVQDFSGSIETTFSTPGGWPDSNKIKIIITNSGLTRPFKLYHSTIASELVHTQITKKVINEEGSSVEFTISPFNSVPSNLENLELTFNIFLI